MQAVSSRSGLLQGLFIAYHVVVDPFESKAVRILVKDSLERSISEHRAIVKSRAAPCIEGAALKLDGAG